jgi:hypothetical protein
VIKVSVFQEPQQNTLTEGLHEHEAQECSQTLEHRTQSSKSHCGNIFDTQWDYLASIEQGERIEERLRWQITC